MQLNPVQKVSIGVMIIGILLLIIGGTIPTTDGSTTKGDLLGVGGAFVAVGIIAGIGSTGYAVIMKT